MVRCLICNGGRDKVPMTKTVIHTPRGKERIYKCPVCNKHFTEKEVLKKFQWVKRRRWTFRNKGGSDE
jgi:transposase-like protein